MNFKIDIVKNWYWVLIILLISGLVTAVTEYKKLKIQNDTLRVALENPTTTSAPVKIVVEKTNTKYINLSPERIKEISAQYEIEIDKLNRLIENLKETTTEKYTGEKDSITSIPFIPSIPPFPQASQDRKFHASLEYKALSGTLTAGLEYKIYKNWTLGGVLDTKNDLGIRVGLEF